jgi:hypothetical protein
MSMYKHHVANTLWRTCDCAIQGRGAPGGYLEGGVFGGAGRELSAIRNVACVTGTALRQRGQGGFI